MSAAYKNNQEGVAHQQEGRHQDAMEAYQQAWTIAATTEDHQLRGMILANMAEITALLGDGVSPVALLDQAEAEFMQTGTMPSVVISGLTSMRAFAAEVRGEINVAEEILLRGLAAMRHAGHAEGERILLVQLAALYQKSGSLTAARSIRCRMRP